MAGLRWRKASYSSDNGSCVELAALADGHVAVRDSKHPEGGVLVFPRDAIRAWLAAAGNGEFDALR